MAYSEYLDDCDTTTGGVNDAKDDQLTSSSNADHRHHSGRSRLHTTASRRTIGAWCPRSNEVGEWIQVDFSNRWKIHAVATQGRDRVNQWVTSYKLGYSDDGYTFIFIQKANDNEHIFTGNTDRDTVVTNEFDSPVIARYFRLYPQTYYGYMCMRWELYGCSLCEYINNDIMSNLVCFKVGVRKFAKLRT